MTKRVLIAEDEESIVASLEFLMRQCGFETRVARDGDDAVACLEHFRPDLVLLDIMLPGRSGFDVCRFIRSNAKLRATRVLMLTARGGAGEEARGLAEGADAYLTKPFATRELVARARALLGEVAPANEAPEAPRRGGGP
jgi:DNA-binding response OmpR family regulator